VVIALLIIGLYSLANYSYRVSPQEEIPVQEVIVPTTDPVPPVSQISPVSYTKSLPELIPVQTTYDQQLISFIDSATAPQIEPIVILSAYFSDGITTGNIKMRGNLYDKSFSCAETPCRLSVTASSVITFQAYTDSGLSSNIVQANINVTKSGELYSVAIDAVSQFSVFSDACSGLWGPSTSNSLSWGNFVQIPSRLNTGKNLHLLAGRLISFGIVDAKDCPGGGLDATGAPNACGLEKAYPALIEWQNQFDFNIWTASRDIHVPPKLIKTLIEIESQFWPSNERLYLDEIGLGQMNQLGMDVILRKNPDLYFSLCETVLGNCDRSYNMLPKELQAMIRGALIESINASCPSCPYGIDFVKAKQSINLLALVVSSTCKQTNAIMEDLNVTSSLEDYWKFTIATYHSGIGCVQNAIEKASLTSKNLDWESVSKNLNCYGGKSYVDNFWNNLYSFGTNTLEPGNQYIPLTIANLSSSQTLLPTPTPIVRNIHAVVNVFQDTNNNGLPDPVEWVNNIEVLLTIGEGTTLSKITENGKADFDLSNYRPGVTIIASLPGYYQYKAFTLPAEGQISIDFIFKNP